MKKEWNNLTWIVTYYDCNARAIKSYDILKYRQDFIKKIKKQASSKEEFAQKMHREMMYYYWSKCEWELIITIDENHRVWLYPWAGCSNPEEAKIDVTECTDFDWLSFAEEYINKQTYNDKAKIDVFDQLQWRWDEFIDYCWYTRLKWERDDVKFHR